MIEVGKEGKRYSAPFQFQVVLEVPKGGNTKEVSIPSWVVPISKAQPNV